MKESFQAADPGHLYRRACAQDTHHIFIYPGNGLQQGYLILRDPHMGAVDSFGLAELIQTEAVQDYIC